MTNPFANGVFGQPAPAVAPPANQWLGQGAPAQQASGPLSPLAGLGTAPAGAGGGGVNMGGFLNFLLLIVPVKAEHGLPRPQARNGETQTRVTADVVVIRTATGQTGPVTLICPGPVGEPPRTITHHVGADGNPDPAKPFVHNPTAGQFLSFPGFWIYGGALADKLLPCLDAGRPDLTMIAAYLRSKKSNSTGNNYRDYEDPAPGDWAEINAVAGAWLAQRGQSQFG